MFLNVVSETLDLDKNFVKFQWDSLEPMHTFLVPGEMIWFGNDAVYHLSSVRCATAMRKAT